MIRKLPAGMKLAQIKTSSQREWERIVQIELDKINKGKPKRDRITAPEQVLKAVSLEHQAQQEKQTALMLKQLAEAHKNAFKKPMRLH